MSKETADRPVLLQVERLTTVFDLGDREAAAVLAVSFVIRAGETLALVGESGSDKSVTALSLLRLVRPPVRITGGSILWKGLNPVFTIGDQIIETLLAHGVAPKHGARSRMLELLDAVQIPDPDRRAGHYPYQLSGGLRQRVIIALALALALAGDPALLIADEPTTGLDATTRSRIVDLLRSLVERHGLSLLLISHDLAVVGTCADRIIVMYAWQIIEAGPAWAVLHTPGHPYTRGLLASAPGSAMRNRGCATPSRRRASRLCLRATLSGAVRPVRDCHAGTVGARCRHRRLLSPARPGSTGAGGRH